MAKKATFESAGEYSYLINKILREDDGVKFGYLSQSMILLRKRVSEKPANWLARISLVPSRFKDLLDGVEYVLEVDQVTFKTLETEQKEAILFHELCHTFYDNEKEKHTLIRHDLEEFDAVLAKYGGYLPDRLRTINIIKNNLKSKSKEEVSLAIDDSLEIFGGNEDEE